MAQTQNEAVELTESEKAEMARMKSYFPYRVVSGLKLQDGTFHVFANATTAKANNFARKNNGALFRLT